MGGLVQHLREQHEQLNSLAEGLRAHLSPGRLESDPAAALAALEPLGRLLQAHLEEEDRAFYPQALRLPGCSEVVGRFEEGMSHLRTTVEAYLLGWPDARHISEDPEGFRDYTAAVLRVLERRIQAEEQELFPRFEP